MKNDEKHPSNPPPSSPGAQGTRDVFSEELCRTVYAGIVDGVLIADVETKKFLFANSTICEMLGYTEAELLTMSVMDIHPRASMGEVLERFAAQAEGRVLLAADLPCLRKDGSQFFADIGAKPITFHERQCSIGFFRDVTKRKQQEMEHTAVLQAAMDGFWIADVQGHFLDVNDACCRLLGYSREELLGMDIAAVEAVESPEDIKRHMQRIMQAGHHRFETRLRRKDWRIDDMEVSSLYLEMVGGRFFVFFRDITERKQAERAVAESEQRYRALFTDSHEPMCLTILGRIAQVNPAWLQMNGYTSESEVLDMDVINIVHPDDRKTLIAWRNTPDRDLSQPEHLRNLRKDGTALNVEVYSSEIFIGGQRAILTTVHDITERTRAERALREQQRRFRDMLGNVRLIGVMLDGDGRITFCNNFLLELTGWRREEVMGADWCDTFLPEDVRERVRQAFLPALSSGNIPVHFENPIQPRAGERRWVSWNNTVLRDESGNPTGLASLGEDVTERRQAEEALRKAHGELGKRVEERTAELQTANTHLQEEIAERKRAGEQIAGLNSLKEQLLGTARLNEKLRLITDGLVDVFGADFARVWITRGADLCEKDCPHGKVTKGPHVCRGRTHCLHLAASSGRYTRTDGSPWELSVAEVLARKPAYEMTYNPNDCAEMRWGAQPGTEEYSTCRRHAPAEQHAKMEQYRVWFREARRPTR